jgi:hypothetical protein
MRCHLDVEVDAVGKTSRTSVEVPDRTFGINLDAPFGELAGSVDDLVNRAMLLYAPKTKHADKNIYIRPGINSTQREYIALTEDNFHVE